MAAKSFAMSFRKFKVSPIFSAAFVARIEYMMRRRDQVGCDTGQYFYQFPETGEVIYMYQSGFSEYLIAVHSTDQIPEDENSNLLFTLRLDVSK